MCEWGTDEQVRVKIPADLSHTQEERWREMGIDRCIAPIVKALQEGGIDMLASCCGHGKGPGRIDLADGRVLRIEASAPTCSGCGGPHRFDTGVPSVLWNQVIRGQGLPDYLCAACVVREFAKAGVSFTAQLYGDGFSGLNIEVRVNGVEAQDAARINDENTALRVAVSEAARILSEAHTAACREGRRD